MTNPIPPAGPSPSGPLGPSGTNQDPSGAPEGPFASAFPTATVAQLKQITNNFINYSIQQMKQDQQNVLQALQQMQQDQENN